MPPGIRWLLTANAVVFILQVFIPGRFWLDYLALTPARVVFQLRIWQLVTYMFLHGGIWHLALNMLVLWMFGIELERLWGTRAFLRYYFISGIGAGFFAFLTFSTPVLGASGAIYGLLLAFGLLFPQRIIYLYAIIPMRAKYFVLLIIGVSLLSGMSGAFGADDGIAHFVHLGGAVVGFFYLRYPEVWAGVRVYFQRRRMERFMKKQEEQEKRLQQVREKVDEILGRINEVGYDQLTPEERRFLKEASEFLKRHKQHE